jgi:hypothetical protein
VQGPSASGVAAIQQLFEALGLVKAPKVEVADPAIALGGRPGERLEHTLSVTTTENRPVYAHAVSDQPWLTVGKATYRGRTASLPLTVEAVPHEPGKTLRARLKVTANGNKRFDVPLVLAVADAPPVGPARAAATHATASVGAPTVPTEVTPIMAPPAPTPVVPVAALAAAADVELMPAFDARPAPTAVRPPRLSPARQQLLLRLVPVALVAVGLLVAVVRDAFFRTKDEQEEIPPIDPVPRVELRFHDAVQSSDSSFSLTWPTMRFGVLIPDPRDPKKYKKLTYNELGRTCNTCVRIDNDEFLLGDPAHGNWEPPIKQALGKGLEGEPDRIGYRSKWIYKQPAVTLEQTVEIIPAGLSPDGSKRLLDTCLVRYVFTNTDKAIGHSVGLRFLLDTYIGANDGVPFAIPGEKDLCDTSKDFDSPDKVPDFISALERQNVKDPGTVAHVSLKVGGGLEPPGRVTLGAWPDRDLVKVDPAKGALARRQSTMWEVPVFSMQEAVLKKSKDDPSAGDSAVTLYWKEQNLRPETTRVLGFAYGLGSVTGDSGKGTLGLTSGGELVAGKEFTLTAYVKDRVENQKVKLELPASITLVGDKETKDVPPPSSGSVSTVTWRVKASKSGVITVRLSSGGVEVKHKILVRPDKELYR